MPRKRGPVAANDLAKVRKDALSVVRRVRFRVGLYARVSTHDQQTLLMQLSAMRTYAKRRGWTVVIEEKEAGSGAKTRPKREELLRAARRREVDAIVRLAARSMGALSTRPDRNPTRASCSRLAG